MDAAYDEYGETSDKYLELSYQFYYEKARVDLLTEVIKEARQAAKKAQDKVDEARLGGGISDYDARDLTNKMADA